MAQNRFASVPNISIPRSRFKQPFNHSTAFNHGELIPIDCFEVLPGDTYKLDLSSLIWMSTPIRPIFGNITLHLDAFFIPMRLVWKYTKEFFGENKTSSGYQTTSYKLPSIPLGMKDGMGNPDSYRGTIGARSVAHYLGKPIVSGIGTIASGLCKDVCILKERCYYEVWNNYYRAQQLQNPILVNYDGNGSFNSIATNFIGSRGAMTNVSIADTPELVNKEFDYFTAATLYPQYGPAVALPLGSYADVKVWSDAAVPTSANSTLTLKNVSAMAAVGGASSNINVTSSSSTSVGTSSASGLFADLSQATAATINQLRYAFAVQKYLERSNFGTRFFEMLQVHYGVSSPDASLQIPQRIGHADVPINISTVLSTAGAAPDSSTELGMPGATSCTSSKKYMFTHAFTEPGYLMVLASTTHERSYTQGILREDLKANRYEIYSPEFANLGDQEILNCEIYYASDVYNGDVFGYQEHWAEYRYRPHRVSGILDPQATYANDFWVLTDDYSQRPHLDGNWIKEDRAFAARCLTSGSTGPDYTADFYFDYTATREMPLFTIPGLIDHFGVR